MKLADSALRAGYRINSFESLRSTNDEALRRAQAGDRGRLWIVAGSQSGGRGRQGRTWTSPPGNVYASLLLVDAVDPALAPQLGFVAGVALVQALGGLAGEEVRFALKWPNDVLVEGCKLAGILVEGSRRPDGGFACVLGFGVNRLSHPPGTPYPVTDLFSVAAARPSLDAIVSALSARMDETLRLWDRGRGFEHIRRLWLDHALPPGTAMRVALRDGPLGGRFETIDASGRLVLAGEGGPIHVDAGYVFLMDQPDRAAERA